MSAIEELELRAGASDQDREAWLAERATGVTATEVKEIALAHGSESVMRRVLREKQHPSDFDNKWVWWGRKREEERLAPWAQAELHAAWEHRVFHHADNPRYLASPDAIGEVGGMFLVEFKTSKFDVSDLDVLTRLGYVDQVQWQMFVTGAPGAYLVGEQHDDVWIDRGGEFPEPTPKDLEPSCRHIRRDDDRIAQLRAYADQFLAFMDGPDETDPSSYAPLVDRLRRARVVEAADHEITLAAETALREALDRDQVQHLETDRWRLSYSAGKPRETFDSKALKKTHPDIYEQFIKTGATPKPRLTLTEKEQS